MSLVPASPNPVPKLALWRCYYCPLNSPSMPQEPQASPSSSCALGEVSWSHAVLPALPPPPTVPRDLAAMSYKISGLFDTVASSGGVREGFSGHSHATLRDLCRFLLLLRHFQNPSAEDSTTDNNSYANRLDVSNVPPHVMLLPNQTVLGVLIPALKGHRRVANLTKQVYFHLCHDDPVGPSSMPKEGAPYHATSSIHLPMFRSFFTQMLKVVAGSAFPASSTSPTDDAIRFSIPTSTGETTMECFVPAEADVIGSVVASEWRRIRMCESKSVGQQEFVSWLLSSMATLCAVPGGGSDRGMLHEVESLLAMVALPVAARVGRPVHNNDNTTSCRDPDVEQTAGTVSPRTRRGTTKKADGSDSRAWMASRVPEVLSRPVHRPTLDGTQKGMNDQESVEGLQHVLNYSKQEDMDALESKLLHQGALRLMDAYPMKLKQQPLKISAADKRRRL